MLIEYGPCCWGGSPKAPTHFRRKCYFWGAAPGTYGYVEPSLVTFNTLISACGKAGKYPEALALWAKMRAARLTPDNFTVRTPPGRSLPVCLPSMPACMMRALLAALP